MASTLSAPNPIKDIYKKLVFYDVTHGSDAFEFQYTNASTLEDVPITDVKNAFVFFEKLTLKNTLQNADEFPGHTGGGLNNNPINIAQLHSDIYGDDYNQALQDNWLPKHRYETTWIPATTGMSLMEVDLEERTQRFDKDLQQDYEFDKLQLLVAGTTWTESQYEADEENPYNPYTTADPTALRPTTSFLANSTPSNLGDTAAVNLINADAILDKEIEHNRTWLETAWNYIKGTDGGSAPAHPGSVVSGEPSTFSGALWAADGFYISSAEETNNPSRPGGAAGPAITGNMFEAIQRLDTESRENEDWLNAINKWIDSSDVDNTDETLAWVAPTDSWAEFSAASASTYTINPVNSNTSTDMMDALVHMDMNMRHLRYLIDRNVADTASYIDNDGGADWIMNPNRRSLTELRNDVNVIQDTMNADYGATATNGTPLAYTSTDADTYANQNTLYGDISEIDAQLEAVTTMITGATTAGAQYSTNVAGSNTNAEADIEKLNDLSVDDTWSHTNRLTQIVNATSGKLENASGDFLDMDGHRVKNVQDPTDLFDATTKGWVEGQIAGTAQGHGVQVCTYRLGDNAGLDAAEGDVAPGGGIMAVDISGGQNWGETGVVTLDSVDYDHGGIALDGTTYQPVTTAASGARIDGHIMVEGDLVLLTEEGATTEDGVSNSTGTNHWSSGHTPDNEDWHWRNGIWVFHYSGVGGGKWTRPSAGSALWAKDNNMAQGLIHAVEFGQDEGDNDVVWAFWTIQPETTFTYGTNTRICETKADADAAIAEGTPKNPRNAWALFTGLQAFNAGNVTTIQAGNTVQVTLDAESVIADGVSGETPPDGGTLTVKLSATGNVDGVLQKSANGIGLNYDASDFVNTAGVLNLLTTRADTMTSAVIGSTNIGSDTLVANLASYENRVGMGTPIPDGTLHVHTATAGSVTPNAVADDLVVENNTDGGITILTPDVGWGALMFGAPSDADYAFIRARENFGTDVKMELGTNQANGYIQFISGAAADAMIIDPTGQVGIGSGSPQSLLDIRGPVGTGFTGAGILTLSTAELTVSNGTDDVLGAILFQSPVTTETGDAQEPAAGIWATAEQGFHSADNSCTLNFATAQSETAKHIDNIRMSIYADGTTSHKGSYTIEEQGRADHVANTMASPYYHFDGVDDNIQVDSATQFNSYPLSVATTICIGSSMPADDAYIFSFNDASDNSIYYALQVNNNGSLRAERRNTTPSILDTGMDLEPNKIYHIVTVFNNATSVAIYVNGLLKVSSTTETSVDMSPLVDTFTLGMLRHTSEEGWWDGDIYNAKVYNMSLSATEVKELYSGASVPFKYKGASQTNMITAIGDSDFSAATNWSESGTTAFDTTGDLSITANSASDYAAIQTGGFGTFIQGKRYKLTCDITSISGSWRWQTGGSNQFISDSFSTAEDGQSFEWTWTALMT